MRRRGQRIPEGVWKGPPLGLLLTLLAVLTLSASAFQGNAFVIDGSSSPQLPAEAADTARAIWRTTRNGTADKESFDEERTIFVVRGKDDERLSFEQQQAIVEALLQLGNKPFLLLDSDSSAVESTALLMRNNSCRRFVANSWTAFACSGLSIQQGAFPSPEEEAEATGFLIGSSFFASAKKTAKHSAKATPSPQEPLEDSHNKDEEVEEVMPSSAKNYRAQSANKLPRGGKNPETAHNNDMHENEENQDDEEKATNKLECKYRKSCYSTGRVPAILHPEPFPRTPLDENDDKGGKVESKKKNEDKLDCKYRKSCYETGKIPQQLHLQTVHQHELHSTLEDDGNESEEEGRLTIKRKLRCKYRSSCYETGKLPRQLHPEIVVQQQHIAKVEEEDQEKDQDNEDGRISIKRKLRCKYRSSCYENGILPKILNQATNLSSEIDNRDADEDDQLDDIREMKLKCKYRKTCYDETGVEYKKNDNDNDEEDRHTRVMSGKLAVPKGPKQSIQRVAERTLQKVREHEKAAAERPLSASIVVERKLDEIQDKLESKLRCKYRRSCYESGQLPQIDGSGYWELASWGGHADEEPEEQEKPFEDMEDLDRKLFCKYRKSCYETGEKPAISEENVYHSIVDIAESFDEGHGLARSPQLRCKYRLSCYETGELPAQLNLAIQAKEEEEIITDTVMPTTIESLRHFCKYRKSCYDSLATAEQPAKKISEMKSTRLQQQRAQREIKKQRRQLCLDLHSQKKLHRQLKKADKTEKRRRGKPGKGKAEEDAEETTTQPAVKLSKRRSKTMDIKELASTTKEKAKKEESSAQEEIGDIAKSTKPARKTTLERKKEKNQVEKRLEEIEKPIKTVTKVKKDKPKKDIPGQEKVEEIVKATKTTSLKSKKKQRENEKDQGDEEKKERNDDDKKETDEEEWKKLPPKHVKEEKIHHVESKPAQEEEVEGDEKQTQKTTIGKKSAHRKKKEKKADSLHEEDDKEGGSDDTKPRLNQKEKAEKGKREEEKEIQKKAETSAAVYKQKLRDFCKYRRSCYESGKQPVIEQTAASLFSSFQSYVDREYEKEERMAASLSLEGDAAKLACKYRKSCYEQEATTPGEKSPPPLPRHHSTQRASTKQPQDAVKEQEEERKKHHRQPTGKPLKKTRERKQETSDEEEEHHEPRFEPSDKEGTSADRTSSQLSREKLECKYRRSCYEGVEPRAVVEDHAGGVRRGEKPIAATPHSIPTDSPPARCHKYLLSCREFLGLPPKEKVPIGPNGRKLCRKQNTTRINA